MADLDHLITSFADRLGPEDREAFAGVLAAIVEAVDPANGESDGDDVAGFAQSPFDLKLLAEILSNVSKTRSEISMTFARNARA